MLRIGRRNLAYRIISLVFAILIYTIAQNQRNPRTTIQIYVQPEVQNLPSGLIVSQPPQGYLLQVNGPAPSVDLLRARGIRASVNAAGVRPGAERLDVSYDLPADLRGQVELVGPRTALLTIARKARRDVAVEVAFNDMPPPGYAFKAPVSRPDRVTVAGLESEVNRVARVVANVDTNQAAGAIDEEVTLVAHDARQQVVNSVEIIPTRARIEIGLKAVPSTKTLLLSPVFVGEVAPGYRFYDYTLSPPTVTVAGSQERLASLTSLEVPVNRQGLTADVTRTVTLTPPPGVRILGSQQINVTVRVRPDAAPAGDGAEAPAPTPP